MKKLLLTLLFCLFTATCFGADLSKVSGKQCYKTTLGAENDEVIIGDEKSSTFVPQIKFTKWAKECSLTLKLPPDLISNTTPTLDKELTIGDSKTGFYFAPQDDGVTAKFGLILYEKPTTNIWTFRIEGQDTLVKLKRPPLHKDNGNGTKTFNSGGGLDEHADSERFYREVTTLETINGREVLVKHLEHGLTFLRPKFIDARGDWIWADLDIQGSDYILTVDPKWLDKAVYPIKANDTVTYQEGVDSYTGCIDTYIDSRNADTNNGWRELLNLTYYAPATNQPILIAFDLGDEIPAGATINSCKLEIYCTYKDGSDRVVGAYRVLKPWTSAGATYNDWVTPNSEWGTAGCNNASDAGTFNTSDGSGYDRWATADDTEDSAGSTWWDWGGVENDAMATSLQAQFDADTWDGWYLNATLQSIDLSFYSSEYGTAASRPKLTVTYTAGGGAAAPLSPIINIF